MNLHVSFDSVFQEQLRRLQHCVLLPATFNGLLRGLFGGVNADLITNCINDCELMAGRFYSVLGAHGLYQKATILQCGTQTRVTLVPSPGGRDALPPTFFNRKTPTSQSARVAIIQFKTALSAPFLAERPSFHLVLKLDQEISANCAKVSSARSWRSLR